jgi:hypothetical protein
MVVINHGCEDFLPIGFPQPGDVGFKISQRKPMSPTMPLRTWLARNNLVNAQAAIRVRQRAGVVECFTSWNLEAQYNALLPPASGVKVSQPVQHRDCGT